MYIFPNAEDQEQWERLIGDSNHSFDVRVRIFSGTNISDPSVYYFKDTIIDLSTSQRLFPGEQPSVGACLAGEMSLRMLKPAQTIPRTALIMPSVRVRVGEETSAWMPQGRYWIDTRKTTHNDDGLDILTIHAYDAMLRTEADYPDTDHDWPQSDLLTVQEIASAIGVTVDPRTDAIMDKGYEIGLPAGFSMRETLGNIAAMYGGNFVMTHTGQLLLVALYSLPPATHFLVTGNGRYITFGGTRIYV